jgi:hypothetical protein
MLCRILDRHDNFEDKEVYTPIVTGRFPETSLRKIEEVKSESNIAGNEKALDAFLRESSNIYTSNKYFSNFQRATY